MNRISPTGTMIIAGMIFSISALAQTGFSPGEYMLFLDQHRDLTTSRFLEEHPPETVCFSERLEPTDPALVAWYDSIDNRFQFTTDEKEMLGKNHFMVSQRIRYNDWASPFIDIYSNDLPLFLSTDFILNTLHNSYDAILQTLEWQFLEPNLKEFLHSLYDYFPLLAARYQGDERFEEVLKDVDLYIAVALSLAEESNYLPRLDTPGKYDEVMEAIEAEQMATMTLFTAERLRKLDFSQFTPRGHYNKEIYIGDGVITLEAYFRTMMWLSRIDFLMTAPPSNPWEPDWTGDELRRMQLGALVLNEAVYGCGKHENLRKHEEIITFMVGPDDNLTPEELHALAGSKLDEWGDLFQAGTLHSFTDALNATDDYGQKIMSNFFYVDPDSADPGELPVSFRLLGQKFLIDSYVFSEVVFDRIVYQGKKIWRPMPDPLDAMAVLGNVDAMALLEEEMESYHYAANMAGLIYRIESYDPAFWEQSLYNTWLGALRELNPGPAPQGLPYFMQTTAWHHEKLNTQLTSWAQLRHDNILYGKQSYTGGTGCSYPYAYVEPYPGLYEKLARFAGKAKAFFNQILVGEIVESKEKIVDYYATYETIMESLGNIARKEIEKTSLSDADITFLKTMINGYMASGPSISGWYNDLFFDVQKGLGMDYTVADVHTQPTDYMGALVGNVLHVGNGRINMGVFFTDNPCNPGTLMAFAGPVSSFHQKVTSGFKRLTDQEWADLFRETPSSEPERPDWADAYLLDPDGKLRTGGRTLKGVIYTGTPSQTIPSSYDYVLLFPNPAGEEAQVRFILNRGTNVSVEVFDVSGRLVYMESKKMLPPAEHSIRLPVRNWEHGVYLVKVNIGDRYETRRIVKSL